MTKPSKRRGASKRRTRTKHVPPLPVNDDGHRARPVMVEEALITLDNVHEYKQANCKYYSDCLDHTSKSGWDQFSCNACKIYELNPDLDEQDLEIISRLTRLEIV